MEKNEEKKRNKTGANAERRKMKTTEIQMDRTVLFFIRNTEQQQKTAVAIICCVLSQCRLLKWERERECLCERKRKEAREWVYSV